MIKYILFLMLIFFSLIPVFAESPDFFMELRFIQRLRWSGDEFAFRYEVIIEKEEEGEFIIVYQGFTQRFFLEVSLAPGKYRYQVIPYDFLDRQSSGSGWISFEVYAALNLELDRVVMEIVHYDTDKDLFLNIHGRNIDTNAEITLRTANDNVFFPDEKYISQDGSSARLFIIDDKLLSENFSITVRNPSGLEARLEVRLVELMRDRVETRIDFTEERERRERTVDFYISAAIMPLFSLYGNINLFSGQTTAFPGFAARLGLVSKRQNVFFNFGFEAAGSMLDLDTVRSTMLDFNLVLQKRSSSGRAAVKLKAGAGYSFINDSSDINDLSDWQLSHIQFGSTFLWFLGKQFFLEPGLDFVYWTGYDNTAACIRPSLGLGFRL